MTDYPTTLEEMEAAFPQVAVETLKNALRDLRQAERDAQCDCPECQEEEKRLAQNHDSDRTEG